MFKKITIGLFAVMVIFIFMGGSSGAVPKLLNYQGKLTNDNNVPVADQSFSFTFRLYNVASGGSALWTESKSISTEAGFFNTILGDTTALNDWIFTFEGVYLGVEVASDGEMDPRQRVVAAGYAINADMLDGYNSSDFLTQEAASGLYVLKTGDSMTGTLTIETSEVYALRANTTNTDGYAISAEASGGGTSIGIFGKGNFFGIYGRGSTTGVVGFYGSSDEKYGRLGSQYAGVYGVNMSSDATNYGGYFISDGPAGYGVYGQASAGQVDTENYGGWFQADGGVGYGIYGYASNASGTAEGIGVYGQTDSPYGKGVSGYATGPSANNYGGYFAAYDSVGLYATNETSANAASLATPSWAGYFEGPVNVVGSVAATDGFYGDGSNLTGIATVGVLDAYVLKAGDTMTGTLTVGVDGMPAIRATSAGYGQAAISGEAYTYGGFFKGNNANGVGVYSYGRTGVSGEGSTFPWAKGVYGYAPVTASENFGVYGDSDSSAGYGVYGISSNEGVRGVNKQNNQIYGYLGGEDCGVEGYYAPNIHGQLGAQNAAVRGYSNSSYAGFFQAISSEGVAVWASSLGTIGGYFVTEKTGARGVQGVAAGFSGIGVYGEASSSEAVNYGGYFRSSSSAGHGLYAENLISGYSAYLGTGLWAGAFVGPVNVVGYVNITGECTAAEFYGDGSNLTGIATPGALAAYVLKAGDTMTGTLTMSVSAARGIDVTDSTANAIAIAGQASATGANENYGGYFEAAGQTGSGVVGYASAGTGSNFGGWFRTNSDTGQGVYAINSDSNYKASLATGGWAGYFDGPVYISGSLEAPSAGLMKDTGATMTGMLTVQADVSMEGDVFIGGKLTVVSTIDPTSVIIKPSSGDEKALYIEDSTGPMVTITENSGVSIETEAEVALSITSEAAYGTGIVADGSFNGVLGRNSLDNFGALGYMWKGVAVYGKSNLAAGGHFEAGSTEGKAVWGVSNASSGFNYGGYFTSLNSPSGYGVYGEGGLYGMYGKHVSSGNYGIVGMNSYGVFGVSGSNTGGLGHADAGVRGTATTTTGAGVWGWATPSGDYQTYGGYFRSDANNGRAVYGTATATLGANNYAGYFINFSETGTGVYGRINSPTGASLAGHFANSSSSGIGVKGEGSSSSGTNYGGYFITKSPDGAGLLATSESISGNGCYAKLGTEYFGGYFKTADNQSAVRGESKFADTYGDLGRGSFGVFGTTDQGGGSGVYGRGNSPTGTSFGGRFENWSPDGIAVSAVSYTLEGTNYGGWFRASSTDGIGVRVLATSGTGTNYGGYFSINSSTGYGIYATHESTNRRAYLVGPDAGVYGQSDSTIYGRLGSVANVGVDGYNGNVNGYAVRGIAGYSGTGTAYGVRGDSSSSTGRGVYGKADHASGTNYGVYGETSSDNGWAGYFAGGQGVYSENGFKDAVPNHSMTYSSGALATGNNYIYPISITPTRTVEALIVMQVQINAQSGDSAGEGVVYLRGAYNYNSTDYNDGVYGHYFPAIASLERPQLSRSFIITLNAGTAYNIGAMVAGVPASLAGSTAYVHATMITFD